MIEADLFSGLNIEFWHWWILACLMLVLEMLVPGILFLWLAVAAAVSGAIVLFFPQVSVELQLIAFGLFSILSFVLGRRFFRPGQVGSTGEDISSASSSLVGKTAILSEKTSNGRVRQSVYGSSWILQSDEDLPKGQKVCVYAIDGNTLCVKAVNTDDKS